MNIFLTGATGVLGRPTTRLLVSRGHHVTALVRNKERADLAADLGATPLVGDIFDAEFLRDAAADAEAIMHLATSIPKKARPTKADWETNDRIRRESTAHLLAAAQGRELHAFVAQSVAFLYGDTGGAWKREEDPVPEQPARNLVSAVEMEKMLLAAYDEHETPVVILRGAVFYGPEAYNTRSLIDAVKNRALPIMGRGEQYWHWIHVDDMARACVVAVESPAPGEVFNVADDWPFRAGDFVNYLANALNAPAPLHMTTILARLLGGETASFLAQSARYRTDKLKRMLGWTPEYPTYREGFAEILAQLGTRV